MDNDVSLAPSNDGHSLLPPSGRSRSPKKKTKKANTVPLAEKCYLISVIYNAQVICSASETASGKGIISFASNQLLGCGSLNPPSLQRALAPAKSAALVASGSLKCSVCDRPAENVCSSLVINQRSNGDELERFAVLDVSEQMMAWKAIIVLIIGQHFIALPVAAEHLMMVHLSRVFQSHFLNLSLLSEL